MTTQLRAVPPPAPSLTWIQSVRSLRGRSGDWIYCRAFPRRRQIDLLEDEVRDLHREIVRFADLTAELTELLTKQRTEMRGGTPGKPA